MEQFETNKRAGGLHKAFGHRRSIRSRSLKYFLIIVAILGFCLVAFFQVYELKIKSLTTVSMDTALRKINLDTYDTLRSAQSISYLVAHDAQIQRELRAALPAEQKKFFLQRVEENGRLYDINRYLKDVTGLYVIGENGALFRSVTSGTTSEDYREKSWYEQVKRQRSSVWLYSDEGSIMVRDYRRAVIDIVVPIIDLASTDFLGAVVGEVGVENLKQITYSGMVFNGNLVMVNQHSQVLYTDLPDKTVDRGELEKAIGRMDSNGAAKVVNVGKTHQYIASKISLDVAGWFLVGLVETKEAFGLVHSARAVMLIIIALSILLSILISVHLSASIARPIQNICKSMRMVEEGDLTVQVPPEADTEAGMLADRFNHMVARIDELVREQKENERELRISELKSLQAQINPHFLYNTLDSINWLARAGRIQEVTQTIDELSIFFRISLSHGKTFISIGDELRHVENYIRIQKRRYEKYLSYQIDIPENIRQYFCLKMVLQPLVENSIYHGIKEKGEHGLILITARETADTIIFTVRDTGIGMKPQKLAELQEMMDKEIEYDRNAYGVINVQRRLRTYFGRQYGLFYTSTYGEGTTVSVVIPKLKEAPLDVESSSGGG